MKYYDWLKKQKHRDDPVGDLAQDAIRDKFFSKNCRSFSTIYKYITEHPRASNDVYDSVSDSYKEWIDYVVEQYKNQY